MIKICSILFSKENYKKSRKFIKSMRWEIFSRMFQTVEYRNDSLNALDERMAVNILEQNQNNYQLT